MAEPRFQLKEPNSDKESLIYLLYDFPETGRFKVSIQKKAHPDNWNTNKGRARIKREMPTARSLNRFIDNLEIFFKEELIDAQNQGKGQDKEYLRGRVYEFIGSKKKAGKATLFDFWERRLEEKSHQYKQSTIKSQRSSRSNVLQFALSQRKNLDFENFSLEVYRSMLKYFWTERGLTDGAIGTIVKNLKAIMADAERIKGDDPTDEYGLKDVEINPAYRHKDFKSFRNTSHVKVALSELQLRSIRELDLSNNQKMKRVRDLFLVGCWLGLRYSDLKRLSPTNYKELEGQWFVKTTLTKSGDKKEVTIPILEEYVVEILKEWEFRLPTISDQKMNDYLKELGELAGLDKKYIQTRHFGPEKRKIERFEYELLTTHSMRRSFCTNLFKRGIPSISIMPISGHATEQDFLKYINVDQAELAQNLVEMFKSSNQLKAVR